MKRWLVIVLAVSLAPGSVACSRAEDALPTSSSAQNDATTTSSAPPSMETTSTMTTTTTPTGTTIPSPTTTAAPSTTVAIPPPSSNVPVTNVPTTAPPTAPLPPATSSPAPIAPAVAIWQGQSGRHEIALTFDAGSDVGATAGILDMLAAEGVPASFGMTGQWAAANPALVARMVDEGHLLLNHTDTHPDMTTITTDERLEQLGAADATVSAITGSSMRPYFRPPFGALNDAALADVGRAGYAYSIMWTVDSLGWKGLDPADVAARCLDGIVDGAILLMHVGSQSTDVDALPAVIDGLRSEGYAFVTIGGLLT